ncbi:hypothetical protein ACFL07_12370 [Pseudomonadota bacterium]
MRSALKTSRYLSIAVIGLTAIAMIALAWPRLYASIRYLPVEIAIKRYYSTREIPTDRLPVLIRFSEQALARHDHYRYRDGLSLLHYLRALDVFTPAPERRDTYRQAEAEAIVSLQRAPARPAVWLRVATIRWILHDEPETIIQPWKMSIFTGRTDSALFGPRVEMGLAHREYMDAEAVAMLRDQILLTWRARPGTLVQIVAKRDRQMTVTRGLLEDTDPTALAEMDAWIAKLR